MEELAENKISARQHLSDAEVHHTAMTTCTIGLKTTADDTNLSTTINLIRINNYIKRVLI
jgi:hypothetical protein